jgi:hypothetical protein
MTSGGASIALHAALVTPCGLNIYEKKKQLSVGTLAKHHEKLVAAASSLTHERRRSDVICCDDVNVIVYRGNMDLQTLPAYVAAVEFEHAFCLCADRETLICEAALQLRYDHGIHMRVEQVPDFLDFVHGTHHGEDIKDTVVHVADGTPVIIAVRNYQQSGWGMTH